MLRADINSDEFVQDLIAGTDEAYKKLLDFVWLILKPRCKALRISHVAEDLVAETIGKLSRTIRSDYDPAKSSFESWVITVGWRVALDEWRRQRRRREIDIEELDIDRLIALHVAEEISGWLEVKQLVERALELLEDIDKTIFCQRVFQGLPFDVIAKNIGTTKHAARMRLSRARDRLWLEMERLAFGDLQARNGRSGRRNPRRTVSAPSEANRQITQVH